MRITTWNVNSLRARLPRVLDWVDQQRPDVLCMQETKCLDEQFPRQAFEERGYQLVMCGQKTYNGVAIASLAPLADLRANIPWPDDDAARGIAATVDGVRVVSLYVPNGRSVGSEHYEHKLAWLDRLRDWLKADLAPQQAAVVCGDFNIAPDDRDVYDPEAWHEQNLCSTPERERFRALLDLGLIDAFRHFDDSPGMYTWWDYRQGMFRRGLGLRIDHHLATPAAMARAKGVEIDREARRGPGPSDHAPVTLVLG